MISRSTPALAIVLALSLAGAAYAQVKSEPPAKAPSRLDTNKDGKVSKEERQKAREAYEQQFKKADSNQDGGLSRDEAAAAKGLRLIERNFDAMDANKDGKVTLQERDAWVKERRAQRAAEKKKQLPQQ